MKATGIVRRVDDLGRIVIPKKIRCAMNICEGEPLEVFVDNDGCVIFKKYSSRQIEEDKAEKRASQEIFVDNDGCVIFKKYSSRQIEEDEAEKRASQESLGGDWW